MKALSISGLQKTYANGVQALKGIDLEVEEGDFFALLGPNGAGKTTMIGIVTSLVNKTAGKVSVFDYDIDEDLDGAKACIGVVPQEINFNQFEKVSNVVLNQAGYYGIPRSLARTRTEKYLRQLQLWDKRHELSRNLSGGMKRRLMIARALVHEPRLLILDEPTAGVDIEIRRSMWDFIRRINQQGTTIILTTHYLEEAESLCRNVAIIDHGKIVVNDRMSRVLRKLQVETFIFNLFEEIDAAPVIEGFVVRQVDEHSFEIEIGPEQNLNQVFENFSALGLTACSMRNKSNRLEELFMRLVESKGANQVPGAGTRAEP
ncbi:MAG: ABC transporter ATP-binding protein [Gammaproteobacteria bacterium]